MDIPIGFKTITEEDMAVIRSWQQKGLRAKAPKNIELNQTLREEYVGLSSALKLVMVVNDHHRPEDRTRFILSYHAAVLDKYREKLTLRPSNVVEFVAVMENHRLLRQYIGRLFPAAAVKTEVPDENALFFRGAMWGFSRARVFFRECELLEAVRRTKELLLTTVTWIDMIPPVKPDG